MQFHFKTLALASICLSALAQHSFAAPNGNPTLVGGTTQFFIAEFPTLSGNYLQLTSNFSSADQFNDHNGDKSYAQDLEVASHTLRLTKSWSKKILGSDVTASEVIVTYVDLQNDIQTPYGDIGLKDDGISDVLFEPLILQWNKGARKQWQLVTGLGFVLPIGKYDKDASANVSGHYFSFAPRLAVKYKFKNGIEAAISPMVNINWENSDSNIKTGHEMTVDYLLAYHRNFWRYGITGYYYMQFEDDEEDGHSMSDSKTEALAMGPALQYHFMQGKGPIVSVSWLKDLESKNKAEAQTLWLTAAIKF